MWISFELSKYAHRQYDFSSGYYVRFPRTNKLKISAKWATDYDYYSAYGGEWVSDQWLHLMFTWKSTEGVMAYLNCCNMDPDGNKGYAHSSSRSDAATYSYPFLVGSGIEGWEDGDGSTIDELYIWYSTLSPFQIWGFYLHGGTMTQ